jgi:hypothetical protein
VKVAVAEAGGRYAALTDAGDCCEAGHPDAAEAARHAWRLTRALRRHEAERAA